MLYRFIVCLFSLLTLFGVSACQTTAETSAMDATDLSQLTEWLEGEWDNIAQVEAERSAGIPEADRRHRYAMRYTQIDAPALEGRILAIENYDDGRGLNGSMERVSLHRFMLHPDSGRIAHEILFLKDKALRQSLVDDLMPLASLTEEDVRAREACRLYWIRSSDGYAGRTEPGACVTDSYSDEPIRVEGFGTLNADRLARHDRNFRLSGEEIPRPGFETEDVFLRVENR